MTENTSIPSKNAYEMLENVPIGIFILDNTYKVLFWNQCLEDWTEINASRIVGHSVDEFYPHLMHARYITRLNQIFEGGPPTIFSSQIHLRILPATYRDDVLRIQHTTVTAVKTDTPGVFHAMFALQDVTDFTQRLHDYREMHNQKLQEIEERKRTEAALRQSEATNRAILLALPDAILRIQNDGRIMDFNPGTEAPLILRETIKLTGKYLSQIFPSPVVSQFHQAIQTALQSDTMQYIEYDLDDEVVDIFSTYEARIVPIHYNELLLIIRDITEQKQGEMHRFELVMQKERVKILQGLLQDISHDIRTPLTVINTTLYILKSMEHSEKSQRQLDILQRNMSHLESILESLLTIFRLDDEKNDFNYHLLDLNEIIKENYTLLQSYAQEKQLDLQVNPGDIQPVTGIETHIKRLISSLGHNAIQYTATGGKVTLRTYTQNHYVILEVNDTGIGIPEQEIPHIFEHFYRVDKARSTTGAGLGLAIAKKIVEMHSGKIEVESKVNEGSTFRVWLPSYNTAQLSSR